MNKRELNLLERAYNAEIEGALNKTGVYVMQTKSKLADKLVKEGFLNRIEQVFNAGWHGALQVRVDGYVLTDAGRLFYCMMSA
jgi:spermidine synthase